jgi:hypothetical protein
VPPRRAGRARGATVYLALVRASCEKGVFSPVSDREPEREADEARGPKLPKFDYHLDESDPDVLVLRRQDGTFVAAFSAQGATTEGILEAAKEDYYAALISEQRRGGHEEPDPAGTRGGL